MFGWTTLGARWRTEQAYQALEILKAHRIPSRMPSDDMFFIGPFHLPHPDRGWQIFVRRWDVRRALALLAREGLMNDAAQEGRAKADADAVMPLTADLTTRKMAVKIRDGISAEDLERFLKLFVEVTFRVKGFVRTDTGMCLVNCVGNLISVEPYGAAVPEDRVGTLIVLSGAGMPVKKQVKEAVDWYKEWAEVMS